MSFLFEIASRLAQVAVATILSLRVLLQEARAAAAEAQRKNDAAGYEVQALREQCTGVEASANERVER